MTQLGTFLRNLRALCAKYGAEIHAYNEFGEPGSTVVIRTTSKDGHTASWSYVYIDATIIATDWDQVPDALRKPVRHAYQLRKKALTGSKRD